MADKDKPNARAHVEPADLNWTFSRIKVDPTNINTKGILKDIGMLVLESRQYDAKTVELLKQMPPAAAEKTTLKKQMDELCADIAALRPDHKKEACAAIEQLLKNNNAPVKITPDSFAPAKIAATSAAITAAINKVGIAKQIKADERFSQFMGGLQDKTKSGLPKDNPIATLTFDEPKEEQKRERRLIARFDIARTQNFQEGDFAANPNYAKLRGKEKDGTEKKLGPDTTMLEEAITKKIVQGGVPLKYGRMNLDLKTDGGKEWKEDLEKRIFAAIDKGFETIELDNLNDALVQENNNPRTVKKFVDQLRKDIDAKYPNRAPGHEIKILTGMDWMREDAVNPALADKNGDMKWLDENKNRNVLGTDGARVDGVKLALDVLEDIAPSTDGTISLALSEHPITGVPDNAKAEVKPNKITNALKAIKGREAGRALRNKDADGKPDPKHHDHEEFSVDFLDKGTPSSFIDVVAGRLDDKFLPLVITRPINAMRIEKPKPIPAEVLQNVELKTIPPWLISFGFKPETKVTPGDYARVGGAVLEFDHYKAHEIARLKAANPGRPLVGYVPVGSLVDYKGDKEDEALFALAASEKPATLFNPLNPGGPLGRTGGGQLYGTFNLTPTWEMIMEHKIDKIMAKGGNGIFLDVQDPLLQDGKGNDGPLRNAAGIQAYVGFFNRMRAKYPGLYIVGNRGWDFKPQLNTTVIEALKPDAIVAESIGDPLHPSYHNKNADDYAGGELVVDLLNKQLKAKPGFEKILTISMDYTAHPNDPKRNLAVGADYNRIMAVLAERIREGFGAANITPGSSTNKQPVYQPPLTPVLPDNGKPQGRLMPQLDRNELPGVLPKPEDGFARTNEQPADIGNKLKKESVILHNEQNVVVDARLQDALRTLKKADEQLVSGQKPKDTGRNI